MESPSTLQGLEQASDSVRRDQVIVWFNAEFTRYKRKDLNIGQ